jgi:glutathionyl-hydroquinone reductase
MVRGLKLFAEYFAGYEDRYVLIGGAACDIWLSKAEFRPRATKDLDLVLVIEAVDSAFVARFWTFVREGGYPRSEVEDGHRRCYRFAKPVHENYPFMMELFSRSVDLLEQGAPGWIVPVAAESTRCTSSFCFTF